MAALVMGVLLVVGVVPYAVAGGDQAPRMTIEELKTGIGKPDLVIIDVRLGYDKAKNKIKRRIKSVTGDPLYEDMKKTWNEILHIRAGETDVEKLKA